MCPCPSYDWSWTFVDVTMSPKQYCLYPEVRDERGYYPGEKLLDDGYDNITRLDQEQRDCIHV